MSGDAWRPEGTGGTVRLFPLPDLVMFPHVVQALLVLALCGVWALGWHLAWQLGRLDTEDAELCLRLFRANRDAGLLPALFFAAAALT